MPLTLEVEPLGLLFALVASSLWIVTSLYSIGYMRGHHEKNQTRFYIFFAISPSLRPWEWPSQAISSPSSCSMRSSPCARSLW